MPATITTFSKSFRVSFDTVSVTGTSLNVNTLLNTVSNVQVTPKTSTQAAGEAAYFTMTFDGTDGLINFYAWDDAGVAATVPTNAMYLVIGT